MGVKAIRAELEVQLLGDFNCVSATATSLGLPETLPVEEWKKIGVQLGSAGRTLQWWIADWWHLALITMVSAGNTSKIGRLIADM